MVDDDDVRRLGRPVDFLDETIMFVWTARSQAVYRLAVHVGPDGVVCVALETGVFLDVSRPGLRAPGHERQQFAPEDERHFFIEMVQQVLKSRQA